LGIFVLLGNSGDFLLKLLGIFVLFGNFRDLLLKFWRFGFENFDDFFKSWNFHGDFENIGKIMIFFGNSGEFFMDRIRYFSKFQNKM